MTVRRDFEYGNDIFDIDVSPDGQYLTGAISDVSGKQKLVRFRIDDLRKGTDAHSKFSTISNTTRPAISCIRPMDVIVRFFILYRRVQSVSLQFRNQENGRDQQRRDRALSPLPFADGSLIAFEYTSKGFVPARFP